MHFQNVLCLWQDLSHSCGGSSTATSSSKGSILVTRSFSIKWRIFYSYILFKRFYFGDKIFLNDEAYFLQLHNLQKVLIFGAKIFLNHVADFQQLHPLQKVLFWWQGLSQSCGGFFTATSSSKGSILVTRSFLIMWRIFYSYILFKRFYFGDKIFLNHVADFYI